MAAKASALGMQTILHDPPLARATGDRCYRPFSEVLRADVLTLHVPLTPDGPDATVHLLGDRELSRVTPSSILINTARGEVVDNAALLAALTGRTIGGAIMDVWEGEPSGNWDLLNHVMIGTPHIAGYSSDGKINGTAMLYDACLPLLGHEADLDASPGPADSPRPAASIRLRCHWQGFPDPGP